MKSSKKLMTRVLTGVLALSMVSGTGICAAAVEDTEIDEEPLVIAAPEDVQDELSRLETLEQMLENAVKNVYARFSQSTAAQLLEIVQEIKTSRQIVVQAYSQVAEMKTQVAEQAVMMMEEAQQLAASMEDEELAAQLIAETEQQIAELAEQTEEQCNQIIEEAEQMSNELLAQASQQFEAIKAKFAGKFAQKYMEIQQIIEQVKQQTEYAKQRVQEFGAQLLQTIIDITTKNEIVVDGDFIYVVKTGLTGKFAIISSYSGEEEDIVVPAFINDIPVKYAMFYSETVKSITLPDTIQNVSGFSFAGASALEEIYIDENNPYFQSVDGVVFDKSGKKLAAVPQAKEYNAPEGTASIGEEAYYNNKMTAVTIPSTVTAIGEGAFEFCENLETVKIPSGVVTIGGFAFAGCTNLKSAFVPASVTTMYPDIFSGCDELTMELETVSCQAYVYARENDINYNCPLSVSLGIAIETSFVDDSEHITAILLGSTVEVSGEAEGGSKEGYQYAFYTRKEGDTKWACKQGFKDNASITFKPEFTGNYEICVKVKDSTGTVSKMYADLFVLDAFENMSTISSETIKKGETVTVNGAANVNAPVAYAVYYKKTTDKKWVTKQDYDQNEEVTIKPAKAADYIICVKAKNLDDGTISKKYFNVTVEA